ncbi:MAG TPA: hypothetical protein VLF18_15435 [Tahibacter sp.]|uniref:hypothetical protein n=1 Tax=Tahibacter sp. TaxID=2056211 RepID=UPI002CE7E0F6|nr:hypothetical protein [Tahibacter sp.]HSX61593.1 hypothetical protein [Tahibacter sp.]
MRYYTIVDGAGVIKADDQKDPIRLALTVFDDDVRQYERRDCDTENSVDEEAFAKQIEGNGGSPPEATTLIAVGSGTTFALDTLAALAKRASSALATRNYEPFVQLILVAPDCATGEFIETADGLSRGALAARVCHRIVVLYADNGGLTPMRGELAGTLGLWGPTGKSFDGVLALDVSALLIGHRSDVGAYLESLEVLGIIARAAGGASNETLRRFARRGADQ